MLEIPTGFISSSRPLTRPELGNVFLYYIYPDSSRNMTPELKLSYVNVDGTWFLGSGIYAKGEEVN